MKNIIKINRLFYFSTIVIFGLSTIYHFAYKWSGYNDFVGAFTPTNESIFQHIKMIFYTITLYYFITYIIFSKKFDIDGKRYASNPLYEEMMRTKYDYITKNTKIDEYYAKMRSYAIKCGRY